VEKYGTARQAHALTGWVTKSTDKNSEYITLIAFFHANNVYANAP